MGNIRTHLQHYKHLYIPGLLASLVFLYQTTMCLTDYSWVFVSSDGGDWMASAIQWMVPQPYGAPVYIMLSHAVNALFPTILPWAMAALLGALPTALTALYTYLAAKQMKCSELVSIVGALLVAGSAVLLTQSTTVGYHAIAVTFLTAAFYQYLLGHKYRTALLLAFGLGVHILVAPIAVFWLVVEVADAARSKNSNELKKWIKPTVVFVGVTVALYSVILLLMYLPTPRYMAGDLSLESALNYWTKTSKAIVGQISIFETPGRLFFWAKLMFMSFGVALLPLWLAFKHPIPKYTWILVGTTLFSLWYFITCLDVLTWTYISFATPSIILLACIGMSRISKVHAKLVLLYACVILVLNPFFMNANTLTQARPQGRELLDELDTLPNNAIVVVDPGCEGFGVIYYINSHPDSRIVVLLDQNLDERDFYATEDYTQWLERTYNLGLDYTTTLTAVQSALDRGYPIYYADYTKDTFEQCFNLVGDHNLKQITSLTGLPRKPLIIWKEKW